MPVDSLDTNLLATGRKPKGEAAPEADLPTAPASRRSKILKIAAYCGIFLISLLFFMILKIPDSLVTGFTLRALNQNTPYNWRADRISFHLFFLPHLTFEKLELEQKFPTGGGPIRVQEMRIYPSLLSLIPTGGTPALKGSFSAEAYQGEFSGRFDLGPNTALSLNVDNLDFAKLEPARDAGLDLKGLISNFALNLVLESQKLSRSEGDIKLSGKNVVFDPASLQIPMALPILDLGNADIQGRILRGKLKLEKFQIGGPTKDLEFRAEGDIQLAEPIQFSRLDLRLRIKPSAKLVTALPTLQNMLNTLAAKRADGFYGLKVTGTMNAMGLPQPDPN